MARRLKQSVIDSIPQLKDNLESYRQYNRTVTSYDDDIAPVKQDDDEKERKWFNSGAFSDGYQFGDVTKSILGTATDIVQDATAGIMGIGEKTIDAGAYLAGGAAKLFGADDFADKTKEFIKKDIIDEEAAGYRAVNNSTLGWIDHIINGEWEKLNPLYGDDLNADGTTMERNSLLGNKTDSLMQSGGQLAGTVLLQSAGVPWFVTTGVTSFGGATEEAFNEDATYGEAGLSSLVSAGADILTEKLFGGSGLGEKGLINVQKLTKGISSKAVKTMFDFGINVLTEGGEEVAASAIQNLGSALYKEENLKDLLFNEEALDEYLESFIGGAVLGGGMNVGKAVKSIKSGTDYHTGFTDSEQAVFDKVYNDAIAEKEADGNKLSKKDKAELYDSIVEKMNKGVIDIDTIESTLGGDEYKSYKDTVAYEDSLKKELDELSNIETGKLTRNQQKRLEQLESMNLDDTTKRDALRRQLDDKLSPMLKNSKLSESYNQIAKKGQAFSPDLAKYTGKQRDAVERAVNSGVLNNTYRSHELVDVLSKIEADKGITFDYTNNAKLKESGFAVEGRTVNGFVKDGGVTLNVQSPKAWESTVGHEVTHVLEGTDSYNELRNALYAYAESKGELESRKATLTELYKNVENTDIDSELTADLVGDYLFNDKDFINKLTENRNVFQKIYDEIKYLCKVATGKELTEIEKVKREFDKAWKELSADSVNDGKAKYSLNPEFVQKYDEWDKQKTGFQFYIGTTSEALKSIDVDDKAIYWDASKIKKIKDKHPNMTDDVIKQVPNILENPILIMESQTKPGRLTLFGEVYDVKNNPVLAVLELNPTDHNKHSINIIKIASAYGKDVNVQGFIDNSRIKYTEPNKKRIDSWLSVNRLKLPLPSSSINSSDITIPQKAQSVNTHSMQENEKYSLSTDSTKADSDYLKAVESGNTETAQKMVDEAAENSGYRVKAYHGTGRADRVGNVFRADRSTSGPMAFFTDNKEIASNYARDKADTSIAYDEEYDSYYTQFRVNRNGKSISVPELWKYLSFSEKNQIKEKAKHIKFDDDYETIIVDTSAEHGNGAWDAYTLNMHKGNALEALVDTWLETGDLYNQEDLFLEVLQKVGVTDAEYRNPDARYEKVYDTWLKIQNPFDTDNATQSFHDSLSEWIDNNDMSVYEKETADADMWDKNNQTPESWLEKLSDDIENDTTHAWTVIPDFVTDYLKSQGYDGIKDKGGKGGGAGHTVWIPFSSEQVKSAEPVTYDDNGNVIPLSQRFDSSKNDIRNSLSNENEQPSAVGTPLRELALEQDIAPVQQPAANSGTTNANMFPADYAPAISEGITDDFSEVNNTVPETDLTVDEKISAKLQNLQTELENNQRLRDESNADFDSEIARLQSEYDVKKNKNTKAANNILRRIERIQRLKANVNADYDSRISSLSERVNKMQTPQYKRAEHRKAKQEQYSSEISEMIGDTSTWKDKKLGISYQTNTLHRNLRDVVRDSQGNRDIAKADEIYDYLQGSYNHNEALLKRESRDIKQQFADMDINKYESEYIQMLGEFKYNPDTKLTQKDVDEYFDKHKDRISTVKVNEAIKESRKVYDSLINRVNAVLRDQGLKEIGYRQGYFPHFTDTKQSWLGKLFNWKTIDTEIPTDIAGITETFEPVRTYQSFDKQRKSDETDYNFLKGFDTYVHGALDWIYHIEDIQKRRAFENEIRYSHSEQGIKDRINEIRQNKDLDTDEAQALFDKVYAEARNPLNNFVTDLRNSTNNLAGKKSTTDRSMEYATSRKIYSTMTNISNRVSGNMVAGSISSALTNFIPITQSWSQVSPVSSLMSVGDVVRNVFRDDGMIKKSDFMTNRLLNEENLNQTGWDKVENVAGGLMNIFDHFTTEVVWRSKYKENMKNGMSENEAIKNADVFAENVMAGRSRGNMPTIYNSKNPITKMFTAFQLEVGNQYGYMFKDLPQDVGKKNIRKLTSGYAKMFIGAYVYNALFSAITGRDSAFDPIGILEDLLKDLGFGDDDDDEETDVLGALGGLGENIMQEVPYVGGLLGGGRVPISSALPYDSITKMVTGTVQDIADKDFDNLTNEWLNPIYYGVMPFGGGQLRKTVQGLSMFNTDEDHPVSGSYNDSGNLRFPVEDTPLNRVQAGIFGQYANENAREYFDNGYAPLKEKQIQEYKDVDIPIDDYWKYREGLSKQETLEDKFDYIAGLDLPVEKKNILINNVVDRKEDVDLEGYDDFSDYEEFDFATKNPEKWNFLQANNISYDEYNSSDESREAYNWASKNPEGYAVSKAVAKDVVTYRKYTSDLYDIKADKDENGKSITGSRKEKVFNYINNLDADYEAKIILFKSEYPSDDTYNAEIIEYLNNREDISYDEMVSILSELGFTVKGDTIYW